MKKLILIALLATNGGAFAQSAALQINNLFNPCGVYVVMHAVETGYPTACDIISNQLYVAAGTARNFTSVWDFQSTGPGWATIPPGAIPGMPTPTTTFQWTDVAFQFDCPSWNLDPPFNCSNLGGEMTDDDAYTLSVNCHTATDTWSGVCRNAIWNPSTGAGVMGTVNMAFW